jgi:hypothetical protein
MQAYERFDVDQRPTDVSSDQPPPEVGDTAELHNDTTVLIPLGGSSNDEDDGQPQGKRWVYRKPADLNGTLDEIEDELLKGTGPSLVLLHGGVHCYVAVKPPLHCHLPGDPTAPAQAIPVLEPYDSTAMQLRIDRCVFLLEETKRRWEAKEIPLKLANQILKKPDPRFPHTIGIVTHPLVLSNGKLLREEGLHTQSRICAHFGGAIFEEPGDMSPEEGIRILREEMLGEFGFDKPADEAVALAFLLTAIERKALDIAPGFLINASTQGSGKTTLARMVHLLLTGHEMPAASITRDGDEQGKAITAMLLQSVPIVCFDNLQDGSVVDSPTLAKVITSPVHTGRILGRSKMATLPTNTVIVVTGNNIATSLDLSRRLLEIRLTARGERPEQRRFKHPDVQAHVLQHRSRWIKATLAILRGSREPKPDAAPSGFPMWDLMVRWPLVNVGAVDPVTKFDDVRENSPELQWMTAWMFGLAHGFPPGHSFRAQDLVKQTSQEAEAVTTASLDQTARRQKMFSDYLNGHPPAKGWTNVNSVGTRLGRLVGRTIEGWTLSKKTIHGTTHYTIVKALQED